MTANIRNDAVTLLRSATVGRFLSLAQNLRLEFIDSTENRHPSFLDCPETQVKVRA